jgi:hypothetical protein
MKRATSVYVIMLIAFGIGLWAIITTGSVFLHAPHDLSGTWVLRQEPASAPEAFRELNIDQSGRFFRISFNGQAHSLSLESSQRTDTGELRIVLRGNSLGAEFRTTPGSYRYDLQTSGALSGRWLAVRKSTAHRQPRAPDATQHASP